MKELKKIIARTLCFMHQRIFRPIYIFNNYAYFLDFRAQKFPLIFLNLNPFHINKPCILGFQIMKNNIKKAPVKFWEDLLYFQHFMQIFVLLQISDYHHLNGSFMLTGMTLTRLHWRSDSSDIHFSYIA